jgi:hypothetical protein
MPSKEFNMKKTMKRTACMLATLLFAGSIAPLALADDKVLPGTVCARTGTTGTLELDTWGKARNPSATSAVSMICPIVKDDAAWSVDTVRVRGLDLTTTGQVSCFVGATQADMDLISWSPTASTAVLTSGWYDIAITPPTVQESGSVVLRCTLPPTQAGNASSVSSIYWNET